MASRRELTACGSLRAHCPADATTILLAAPAMSFRLDAGGWCGRARACGVSVKGRRSRFLRFPAPRFKNTGGSRDTHGTDTRHTKLPDRYATYCTLKYDLKPLRNLATGTVPVIRDFMVAHATLRCDARTHATKSRAFRHGSF
jgi:hypothetical protein